MFYITIQNRNHRVGASAMMSVLFCGGALPFHQREEQEQWRAKSNLCTHQFPLCSLH